MAFLSDRPITVDGVRLDTLAIGITAWTVTAPGTISRDVSLPGMDGVVPGLNEDREPGLIGLELLVRGADPDGRVPAGSNSRDEYAANLDELLHLFAHRHRLLDVRRQVTAAGDVRQALCKVQAAVEPDDAAGSSAVVRVALQVPAGVWQDPDTSDWSVVAPVPDVALAVPTLQGATERVQDEILTWTGPWTTPGARDPATGAYVRLNANLAAGEVWRLNVGTWSSRVGGTLNPGSSDFAGTDMIASTTYGGTVNQAAFLPLVPERVSPEDRTRQVRIVPTGSGTDAASALAVRARRKYRL